MFPVAACALMHMTPTELPFIPHPHPRRSPQTGWGRAPLSSTCPPPPPNPPRHSLWDKIAVQRRLPALQPLPAPTPHPPNPVLFSHAHPSRYRQRRLLSPENRDNP